MQLNAQQLRVLEETTAIPSIKRNPWYLILENIYDTYNIGGLFRLADALAFEKIFICGTSETPPNSKIKKASIGTYKVVQWHYTKTVEEAITQIKTTYPILTVVAIEQNPKAIPYTKGDYTFPLALVVGNETYGILPETLKLCDKIVDIPMYGINKSLNVIVAAAVVGYHINSFIGRV